MMATVKIVQVGEESGIVLPEDVLERLCVAEGDVLQIVESANGVELVRPGDDSAAQMKVAEKVMSKRRDVLKKLAE